MTNVRPSGRLLLAVRHQGLTEGLRSLLETEFSTVVMVADLASFREGASRLQPDFAIADQSLDPEGGLGWLKAVKQDCPGLKVVVLSVHDEATVRDAVLRAGADGFVVKRAIATDLLPAVERVRQREGEPR